MAHVGSAVVTAVKAFSASSYQNECSSATARSKSAWTAGAHETGKRTVPSFSPSCADATGTPASRSTMSATAKWRVFITTPSFEPNDGRAPPRGQDQKMDFGGPSAHACGSLD